MIADTLKSWFRSAICYRSSVDNRKEQKQPKIEGTEVTLLSRTDLITAIEQRQNSKVIVFVTGDRPGMETQISNEAVEIFVDHLDEIWPAKKITLFLYTRGGDTAAAWRLINLLQTFCDELEVIVPSKAMSAGTLICLGANCIIMTKQGALGPIDPSLNSPMNPQIPGTPHRAPVAVEAVQGFLDLAKEELGITDQSSLAQILGSLSDKIHPLVLGQIYRSRAQIRQLATKLLNHQQVDNESLEKIVSFLCSDSGSHDHTLNRREAKGLGLNISHPDDDFYNEIRGLYRSISDDLSLRVPFSPDTVLAGGNEQSYSIPRALIESIAGGTDEFVSEGIIKKTQSAGPNGAPMFVIQDQRQFESWRKRGQR